MKILSTTNLYNYPNKYSVQPKIRQGVDTFTRTTAVQNPSFKSNNALKSLLNNKELVYTMGLGVIVKELLNKSDTDENLEEKNGGSISDFLLRMFSKKEDEQNVSAEETKLAVETKPAEIIPAENEKNADEENLEINVLRNEIKILRETIDNKDSLIADLYKRLGAGDTVQQLQEPQEPQEEQTADKPKIKIFPPRRGNLSKEHKQLRSATENLDLPLEEAQKLNEICTELLDKNSKIVNGEEINKKEISANLAEDLSKGGADCTKIIEEYRIKLGLVEQSEPAKQDETGDFVPLPRLQGVRVVGKVDLDSINDKKTGKSKKVNTTPNSDVTEKPAAASEEEIHFLDKAPGVYMIKIPIGLLDEDVSVNLNNLLYLFETKLKKNYKIQKIKNPELKEPRWMHRPPTPQRVSSADILQEVNTYNKLKQNNNDVTLYKQINKDNAEIIAEAINENPYFNQLFSLHASLRLIDRYVDCDKSDDEIKEDINFVVDKLVDTIQNALRNVLEIQNYEDKKYKGHFAPRLIIPPECMDEDAQRIFGTDFPLKVGLCENQPDLHFYNNYDKPALICTLFSKGL